MKSELKKLIGRIGSFYGDHIDRDSRNKLAAITKIAAACGRVGVVDEIAATALGNFEFIKEDFELKFNLQGHLGTDFEAFEKVSGQRSRLGNTIDQSVMEFDQEVSKPDGDSWYVLRIPTKVTPVMLQRNDVALVNGVDFLIREGLLYLRANYVSFLPELRVLVRAAICTSQPPNQFVIGLDELASGSAAFVDFRYKSQSVSNMENAAAQYAGLYVFDSDDELLDSFTHGDAKIYTFLRAGQLLIDYLHEPITPGQVMRRGDIIRGRFEIVTATSAAQIVEFFSAFSGVSMDYVFPWPGMIWHPGEALSVDYTETHSGKPHALLMFDGALGAATPLHAEQKKLDLATPGNTLADELGLTLINAPLAVNFAEILWDMYGSRLCLVAVVGADINAKVEEFLSEHRTTGTIFLKAIPI